MQRVTTDLERVDQIVQELPEVRARAAIDSDILFLEKRLALFHQFA